MNWKKYLWLTLIFTSIFTCKNVYAFDVNNYKNRSLCAKYEVAGFHSDGYIDTVACYSSYAEAKEFMPIYIHGYRFSIWRSRCGTT